MHKNLLPSMNAIDGTLLQISRLFLNEFRLLVRVPKWTLRFFGRR